MGIRLRLLLTLLPLAVLSLALVALFQLSNQQINELVARRQQVTEDLLKNQAFDLAIMREHDAIIHLAEGHLDLLPAAQRHRQDAQALLAAARQSGDSPPALDRQVQALYAEMIPLNDQIISLAVEHDFIAAQALVDSAIADEKIDALMEASEAIQQRRQEQLLTAAAAVAAAQQRATTFGAAVVIGGFALSLVLTLTLALPIVRPLERLAAEAERYAAGDSTGQLSAVSEVTQVRLMRDAFQKLLDVTLQRQDRLQQTLGDLERQMAHERNLQDTVRALSVPVIPLDRGTLLLPLIGHLDARRAADVNRTLLEAISRDRTHTAVLDITGLAQADAEAAAALQALVQSAKLLGCEVVLVGVRPEHALILARSDLSHDSMRVARDIPMVLQTLRGTVV